MRPRPLNPRQGRAFYSFLLVGCSLLLSLGLGELIVRLLEHRAQTAGQLRQRYEDAYQAKAFRTDGLGDAGFLAPGFSGQVTNEFGQPVDWVQNELGFRRREAVSRERPPGSLRVLMVGDSFIVGHRLAQEDTVGAQLERALREDGRFGQAEVLIAAIEHPAKGLEYLERFGLAFKPQAVYLGLTLGNDVAQIYFTTVEAGEYRLKPDGVEPNPGYNHAAAVELVRSQSLPADALGPKPGATPWNAQPPMVPGPARFHLASFLSRMKTDLAERRRPQAILSTWGEYSSPRLFDGNGLGLFLAQPPAEIEVAYQRLERVLAAYHHLAEQHGARLIVAVHAQRFQLQPRDWQATTEAYGLAPQAFDLEAPNRRIAEFCQRKAVLCLDPTAPMAAAYARDGRTFFMPRGDMHWNTLGSRTFFSLIRRELLAALPVTR